MTTKNVSIQKTTVLAGIQIRLALIAATVLTAYYRLALPFLVLSLCLAYLFWSYFWTLMSCRHTNGKSRLCTGRIFAGETVVREFKFINRWVLPLVRCGIHLFLPPQFFVFFSDPVLTDRVKQDVNLANSAEQIHPVWNRYVLPYAWLSENKEITVRLRITAPLRGIYYLPPPHFFTGDPSGLFRGLKRLEKGQYWYVYPDLEKASDLMKALFDEEIRNEDSWGIEDRYEYQGVREYQPLDPPRSINWYAAARTGKLKTNLYMRKRAERCLVALDLTAPGHLQQPFATRYVEDPPLEKAIGLAAGIALYYLEQGSKTAFYTNAPLLRWTLGESGTTGVYQERVRTLNALGFDLGAGQVQRILELCSAIDSAGRAFPADQEKLWSKIAGVPAQTLIYILTYHTFPAGMEKTAEDGFGGSNGYTDPALFYSPDRLATLAPSRVRLYHLTPTTGGESK